MEEERDCYRFVHHNLIYKVLSRCDCVLVFNLVQNLLTKTLFIYFLTHSLLVIKDYLFAFIKLLFKEQRLDLLKDTRRFIWIVKQVLNV